MANKKRSYIFLILALGAAVPLCGYGNTGGGVPLAVNMIPVADTSVQPPAKPATTTEKPSPNTQEVKVPDIIKEVPKSRRKLKPIAVPVPVPVKPLKVIKPKVIKVGI